jgi:predicted esterase
MHPPPSLFKGKADATIPPPLTAQLARRLRAVGQRVDLRAYPGAGHVGILAASRGDVLAWIDGRFRRAGGPLDGSRTQVATVGAAPGS